jgi:hypothetical protein
MSKGRKARPKTNARLLERLPQFQPSVGFDVDHVDIGTGAPLSFSPKRHKQISNLLSKQVRQHVRTVNWLDKPTGLERFLREAVHAIAVYLHQCDVKGAFDRKKAKVYLSDAADAVCAAQEKLQAIAGWPELSSFLERLFAEVGKRSKESSTNSVLHQIKLFQNRREEREILGGVLPKRLASVLSQLEPLLTLAAERVEFLPGDFQRDDAAQEFVDKMALAWISGTGYLPTYSRPTARLRKPSPFAKLLRAVNQKVFNPKIRSPNDFREYALRSVKRMKERFPELACVSGRPPQSK